MGTKPATSTTIRYPFMSYSLLSYSYDRQASSGSTTPWHGPRRSQPRRVGIPFRFRHHQKHLRRKTVGTRNSENIFGIHISMELRGHLAFPGYDQHPRSFSPQHEVHPRPYYVNARDVMIISFLRRRLWSRYRKIFLQRGIPEEPIHRTAIERVGCCFKKKKTYFNSLIIAMLQWPLTLGLYWRHCYVPYKPHINRAKVLTNNSTKHRRPKPSLWLSRCT
jgi:hypothetical protein